MDRKYFVFNIKALILSTIYHKCRIDKSIPTICDRFAAKGNTLGSLYPISVCIRAYYTLPPPPPPPKKKKKKEKKKEKSQRLSYVLENHTGLNFVPCRYCPVHNTLRPRQNGRHFLDFSYAFSWMMMYKFRLKFHRSVFLRFKLIIYFSIGSDNGLAPVQATSHYLN